MKVSNFLQTVDKILEKKCLLRDKLLEITAESRKYSQTFTPDMIAKYFEDMPQYYLKYILDSFYEAFYSVCTLDDFINHCLNAGIKLEWRMES